MNKLNWIRKGLIFDPSGKLNWASHTALQPTPLRLSDEVIRVFAGFRDDEGISRVGWVDVDSKDPSRVLGYSKAPALDTGLPGTFDDNGVVPSAVVKREDKIYLYYAGYQIVKNVRFLVLCGLAVSTDNGDTFSRLQHTPVLERTDDEFLFRVIHTILWDEGKWKVWYGGGNHFIQGGTKTLPVYDIRYMESADGIHFPAKGKVVLQNGEGEHRVGRPYVIKRNGIYQMFFGASTPQEPYRLSFAESTDGLTWQRKDDQFGLAYTAGDFDSDMSAYPGLISVGDRLYMFYNGNEYGRQGFGYALLDEK